MSNTKKPVFFYVNLAKVGSAAVIHFCPKLHYTSKLTMTFLQRFLQEHGEVQLSALGLGIDSRQFAT